MVVNILVFTSPTCPHCPSAVKLAEETSKEIEDVVVEELSSMSSKGQSLARKHEVMSVPTLIIKGEGHPDNIGIRGTPSKKDLLKVINIAKGIEQFEEKKGFLDKLLNAIHKRFKVNIKL